MRIVERLVNKYSGEIDAASQLVNSTKERALALRDHIQKFSNATTERALVKKSSVKQDIADKWLQFKNSPLLKNVPERFAAAVGSVKKMASSAVDTVSQGIQRREETIQTRHLLQENTIRLTFDERSQTLNKLLHAMDVALENNNTEMLGKILESINLFIMNPMTKN